MATSISSGEAHQVLSKWKEDGTSLSLFGIASVVFVQRRLSITEISPYFVKLESSQGHLSIPIDGAESKSAEFGVLPAEISEPKMTAKMVLRIRQQSNIFILAELTLVSPGTGEKQ